MLSGFFQLPDQFTELLKGTESIDLLPKNRCVAPTMGIPGQMLAHLQHSGMFPSQLCQSHAVFQGNIQFLFSG